MQYVHGDTICLLQINPKYVVECALYSRFVRWELHANENDYEIIFTEKILAMKGCLFIHLRVICFQINNSGITDTIITNNS